VVPNHAETPTPVTTACDLMHRRECFRTAEFYARPSVRKGEVQDSPKPMGRPAKSLEGVGRSRTLRGYMFWSLPFLADRDSGLQS